MLAAGVAHTVAEPDDTLLRDMAASLSYRSTPDSWKLGRIGLVGPEPTFNRNRSKFGLVIGQVFDDSDQSLLDLLNAPASEIGRLARGLNGSFCIVLGEFNTGRVTLISDRFGSQPMFYALSDGLVFASQAIAVLQSPGMSPEINLQSLFEFIAFQTVWGTRALEKSIAILPPASVLTFDGQVSLETYWERRHHPLDASEEEFAEEMAATLRRTMSRVGGENPALMLSGGLDSRMVLAACESPPRCLTMGDYQNSEYRVASRIAQVRGVSTELLQRDPDHYVRLVDPAVRIGSGMYNFFHAHALGFLETIDCDVMLHGYCPESYFRGTHLPTKTHKVGRLQVGKTLIALRDETFSEVIKERAYYSLMMQNPAQVFSPDLVPMFAESIDRSIDSYRRAAAQESDDLNDQFLWFDAGHASKNGSFLLQLAFRPYMREASLLFDNDVLDLYLKMPVWARAGNQVWLKALTRLNPEIAGIPDANTGWHHRVPKAVAQLLNAPANLPQRVRRARTEADYYRSDFSFPLSALVLRHNVRMRDMVASAIDDLDPGLFNLGRLKEMFDGHMSGRENWATFLCLISTFSRWRSVSTRKATATSFGLARAPKSPEGTGLPF